MLKRGVIVCFLFMSFAVAAAQYNIGTGSQSGTYYPFGGALAKIWDENIDNFNMKVEVTAASVENTIKVFKKSQLTGIAMGNVVQNAYEGKKPFPKKMPVNVLMALYPNVLQLVVLADSPIKSISDLKGKRVSLGAAGSGTRVATINILAALGIKEKDMTVQSLNYTATTNALANGQIDAGSLVSSLGVGAINELALTKKIRILSFTKKELATVIKTLPAYQAVSAKKDLYKNTPAFTAPAVWNVLVVNQDLNKKLAYKMVKTAYEHMDEIQKTINVARFTTPENARRLTNVPLHPGTLQYLKEINK